MSKFWHIAATIGMAGLAAAVPSIQSVLSGHLLVTGALGVVWTILGNLLPSPVPGLLGK